MLGLCMCLWTKLFVEIERVKIKTIQNFMDRKDSRAIWFYLAKLHGGRTTNRHYKMAFQAFAITL